MTLWNYPNYIINDYTVSAYMGFASFVFRDLFSA